MTAASCIDALGLHAESKSVVAVAVGAHHVIALSSVASNKAADSFRYLLDDGLPSYADVEIFANEPGLETKVYKCHRIVLAARSRYLRSYLLAAEASTAGQSSVSIDLTAIPGAGNITISGLLDYLYLDKVNVPKHKLVAFAELAHYLLLTNLRNIIVSEFLASERSLGQINAIKTFPWFDEARNSDFASTFTEDMSSLVTNPLWHDVEFIQSSTLVLRAHKSILLQFDYFRGLFGSAFRETNPSIPSKDNENEVMTLPLDGFIEDGITPELFRKLLEFAYCGRVNLRHDSSITNKVMAVEDDARMVFYDDLADVMSLLIAANRLGHMKLVTVCERELILNLRDPFPDNAKNCLEFATEFGFPVLARACAETLRIGNEARLNMAAR